MPQNFYELVWIFIIYAFIGWCTEVSYAALDRGIFVNRGFLNGPYCPNLRMWSGDCCSCFDSAKGQPADIICGFFLTDFHFGIHYRIYFGKSVSQ